MRQITADDALEALRTAVKGREDYVYPWWEAGGSRACKYVRDGAPSCLVGHALHALGIPLDTLTVLDSYQNGSGVAAGTLPQHLPSGTLTVEAAGVFGAAQTAQDTGESWGEALASAAARHAAEVADTTPYAY